MQRDMYDTVTLSILVPTTWEQRDGVASFLPGTGAPIRTLTSDDVNPKTKRGKQAWRALAKRDRERIVGLVALKGALETKDQLAIKKASARLEIAGMKGIASRVRIKSAVIVEEWDEREMPVLGLAEPQDRLSLIVSEGLKRARLVLWWREKEFVPGLYCQDIATALYVRAMLKFLGGGGLKVCPHCSELFIQSRSDVEYCSVAHREAHRVARWRAERRASSIDKGPKKRPNASSTRVRERRGQ